MKKMNRYLRYAGIYIGIIAVVLGVLLVCNKRQLYLYSGDALPGDMDERIYTVLRGTPLNAGERMTYTFFGNEDQDFSIILMHTGASFLYSVYVDDTPCYEPDGTTYNQLLHIDSRFYDAEQNAFSFSIKSETTGNLEESVTIVLGSSAKLEQAKLLYITVHVFTLGMLFLMFAQSFFLYCKKRDEAYLLRFAVYSIVLLIWGVSKINLGFNYGLSVVLDKYNTYIVLFNIVISAATCCSLLGVRFKGRWNLLTKWYVLFAAAILLRYLITLLPVSRWAHIILGETLRTCIYVFTLGVLLYGSVENIRGSRLISVGFCISWGLRLLVAAMILNWTPTSYFSLLLRVSRLVDLPLAMSFLFYINSTFAEKFKDAERLSGQLAEANATLDKKVAERTRQLEEQQQQRRSMMMNTFHDLRSPLFIVKGCAQIIPAESEAAKEKLAVMKERLDFAIHLTEELFLAAKLEEHQLLLDEDPYDLSEVLRAQVDSALLLAGPKHITLESTIVDACILCGDAYRIAQAIQNLVTNAIQFAPEGGRVEIAMIETKTDVRVSISDTGRGMDSVDTNKVFTRFYRVEASSRSASTGLGLSIAKEIIEQHGGEIMVRSEKDVGTCFTVILPKNDFPIALFP